MNKLKILPLEIPDIADIKSWQTKYKGHPNYSAIEHFILEDNLYYGLDEVVFTNYELYPIGNDERKFSFALKDGNKTAGFILAHSFNLTTEPELFLQYIVLHPEYQHKGYGKQVLKELLNNTEKYVKCDPSNIYAYIDKQNSSSLHLFENFGFLFKDASNSFKRAIKYTKILENHF